MALKQGNLMLAEVTAREVGHVDLREALELTDLLPDDPGFDELPTQTVCLHCLLEDGDEQLGRGLDLAKRFGQVDWDVEAGKWLVAEDSLEERGS